MENRYQLTSEEINKILCRSPRSLSASPAEQGLGAQQIKKYFYDFIYYMAQLLNTHLGSVGKDVTALDTGLVALQEALTESIADSVLDHATDANAHEDIRESLAEAVHLANVAYNLASGKSKVYVNTSFQMALFELQNEELHQGDFIMVIDKSTPDFVVLDYVGSDTDVTEVDFEDVINNSLPAPKVGEMFRLKGFDRVLLAIESGIDAETLSTKDDLSTALSTFGQYRVVRDVTLAEDTQFLEVTQDTDGVNLNLKKFIVLLLGKCVNTSGGALKIDGNDGSRYFCYLGTTLSNTTQKGFWLSAERLEIDENVDNLTMWRSIYPKTSLGNFMADGSFYAQGLDANNADIRSDFSAVDTSNTIKKLRIGYHTDANALAAGTRILVLGVDNE